MYTIVLFIAIVQCIKLAVQHSQVYNPHTPWVCEVSAKFHYALNNYVSHISTVQPAATGSQLASRVQA